MTPELENKLRLKYPGIFDNMFNGHIECGDGWYALIDYIAKNIKFHNDKINLLEEELIHFDQIKEKFGALRAYVNYYSDGLFSLINDMEGLSSHICEECGRPGSMSTTGGWMRTRCADHEIKNS